MNKKRLWALAFALMAAAGTFFNPAPARAQQPAPVSRPPAASLTPDAAQRLLTAQNEVIERLGNHVRTREAELATCTRSLAEANAAAARCNGRALAGSPCAPNEVTQIRQRVHTISTRLTDLTTQVRQNQQCSEWAHEAFTGDVCPTEESVAAFARRCTGMTREVEYLASACAERVRVRDELARHNGEIVALRTDVNALRTDVNGLRTDVNGLRTDVNNHGQQITSTRTVADHANTEATRANTRLDAFPRLGGWIGGGGTLAVTPVGFAAGASAAGGFRLRLSDDWAMVLSGHIGYGMLIEAGRSGVIFGGDISAEVRISDAVRLAFGLGVMSTSTPTSYESGRPVGGNLGTGGMLTARIHAGAFYAQIAGVLQPTLTRDQTGAWMSGGTGAGMFLNVGAAFFR